MTNNRRNIVVLGTMLASIAIAKPSFAFTIISQPDATYQASTSLIGIPPVGDYSNVTSVTDGAQTVSFNHSVQKRTVPNSWSTWSSPPFSESSTPSILYYSTSNSSIDLALAQSSSAFGLEIEPNSFSFEPVLAEFFSGANLIGSINQSVNGYQGARLFAATTDASNLFTLVRISSSDSFSFAQLRYSLFTPPPAVPGPLPIFGALSAFSMSRRLRRRLKVHTA